MGRYINPPRETKEDFLKKFGSLVDANTAEFFIKSPERDNSLVCWVNNGPFTAAGVVEDLEDFTSCWGNPKDFRPKKFFLVNTDELNKVLT